MPRYFLPLFLVLWHLVSATRANALTTNSCAALERIGEPALTQYTFSGNEKSLKDLEPVFRNLFEGEPFELHIPKGTKLELFPREPAYRVRHSGGRVDYFPYILKAATTTEAKYKDDQLRFLQTALYDIERAQKQRKPLSETWTSQVHGKLFFTPSPTTGKSMSLYQHPNRVEEIVEQTKRLGRSPFLYFKDNGDMVLTNLHMLRHLKAQGLKTLTLYRGHHSFDYFFYRILLDKSSSKQMRSKLADWLERNQRNFSVSRKVDTDRVRALIHKLRDQRVTDEAILAELTSTSTTASLFTSMTKNYTERWAENKENSEILTLKLDLERLPDWYLEEIMYGNDLDVEIVFPFYNEQQRQVLRSVLNIEEAVPVK